MAAVIGTPYSPPSPPDTSSSATMSPVYPDRPIRPLPRRKLRAQLSPEFADQISLPSAPQATGAILSSYKDAMTQRNGTYASNSVHEVDNARSPSSGELELDRHGSYRFKGNIVDSDEEEQMGLVHRLGDYTVKPGMIPITTKAGLNGNHRSSEPMAHSTASSNESIDGYDSFENTNNKKKRKIPTSGSLGSHHTSISNSLSSDLANMGISGTRDLGTSLDGSGEGAGQYYGSGNSAIPVVSQGTGISGAGRGRYGRSARRDISGRSPLALSSGNAPHNWQPGRTSGVQRDYGGGASLDKVNDVSIDGGIISAAMAKAAAPPSTPPQGLENVSLLDQSSSKGTTHSNSKFTFTCESESSSKGLTWPDEHPPSRYDPYPQPPGQDSKPFSQGTQTSPSMVGQPGQNATQQGTHQTSQQPVPRPRRSAAKRYAMAERQRKLQQQYSNYHHPPREEDLWICEFCEYESIFGMPPRALVRQYEIKDSRERKRQAEKRRLLEKAKMKGRKGKKGNKNASKQNPVATQQQQQVSPNNHALHPADPGIMQGQDTQSDEYYGEEYEDDPPESTLTRHEVPSRIPRAVPVQNTQGPQVAQSGT